MYAAVASFGLGGIDPYLVSVEVDSRRAMPGFELVGLPDAAVKESRDRVRSAVQNLGYQLPTSKIVVNLAPADTKKQGPVYDLPILLALLAATGCESYSLEGVAALGEVGLNGEIRPVAGVLPMVMDAAALGVQRVVVPAANAAEASVVRGTEIYCAAHAGQVIAWLRGEGELPRPEAPRQRSGGMYQPDLVDVKGQQEPRRALEIAAAGGHNLLLIGAPGSGKSMLAKRLPSILPPMTRQEALEVTKIHSVAGTLPPGVSLLESRPFRAPHHTVSAASLTGGGPYPRPGDISLAHSGVLFLDELPQFQKNALEVLRQPLEDGAVSISRVRQRISYPSRFMLVAAMNPCPCGMFGHPTRECTCAPGAVQRYLGRVSGPLLDRIDLHVEVLPVAYEKLRATGQEETSAQVARRVAAARELQTRRFAGTDVTCNALIPPALLDEACRTEPTAQQLLAAAFERMGLSARGYGRILKVARTIADLAGAEQIGPGHISQAIQFRGLDRKYWGGV